MTIVTVGIDFAKNVFAAPAWMTWASRCWFATNVARGKRLELIASPRHCLIGMEVSSESRQWNCGSSPQ
jgi:hypothetical protein